MKNLRITLLIATLLTSFAAFAGEPIPGVDVKFGKNPGGSIMATSKTDNEGKFTLNLSQGSYTLNLSYADAVTALKRTGKTVNQLRLTLTSSSLRVLVNDKVLPAILQLTNNSNPIVVIVPAGGCNLMGQLTNEPSATNNTPQPTKK